MDAGDKNAPCDPLTSRARRLFSPEELEELRAFDEALEMEDLVLTAAERQLSKELDMLAAEERAPRKKAKKKKTGGVSSPVPQPPTSEEAKARKKQAMQRYRDAHRDEINARQRTYYLEHKAEILAKARASHRAEKDRAKSCQFLETSKPGTIMLRRRMADKDEETNQ